MSVLPIRLLRVIQSNLGSVATWNEDDGTGDPWVGYPYKWRISLTVSPEPHSSVATRTPFAYTGLDIEVGDWVATDIGGAAVRIYEIESASDELVTCLVEDVERFNIMSDPLQGGSGISQDGSGYVFEIGDDGMPILGPASAFFLPITFQTDLEARFRYRNLQSQFVSVNQPGHTLLVGDMIRPDASNSGQFLAALADSHLDEVVGTVTSIGTPGVEWFTFRPLGKLLTNISPALTGNYGDLFYVDPNNAGKLTNIRPPNARPVYMRLETDTKGILLQGGQLANETIKFDVSPTDGQTDFTLPADALEVIYMSINGIENSEFTFDSSTKVLSFDAAANGYGVDHTDEVFFLYKT